MNKRNFKGWLYLLPAMLFLGIFMVYPLIDVFIYSFEEGYNSASQTYIKSTPLVLRQFILPGKKGHKSAHTLQSFRQLLKSTANWQLL